MLLQNPTKSEASCIIPQPPSTLPPLCTFLGNKQPSYKVSNEHFLNCGSGGFHLFGSSSDEMDSNGIAHSPKVIEEEGSSSQEVQKGFGQTFHVDASVELENKSVNEQFDAGIFNGTEEEMISALVVGSKSKNEQFDAGSFDGADAQKISSPYLGEHSDVGSPDGVDYRRTNSLQQSSVLEISPSKDPFVTPPRQAQKSLDHCITAPVGTRKTLFLESHEVAFSRSMTDKRECPRPDLKLDRLSELAKKNLIANLVKIQNDGTVEVDLTKSAPVASELLQLQSIEGLPSNIDCVTAELNKSVPKLKIAIIVEFGHHVRLATHVNFSTFVKSAGIDFYPLGDMARNKGLIPSAPGEISIQRKQLKAIIESLLPACTEPDVDTGEPFRAQAIIANPPAYGHAHVAEALAVPLHIFFTMPWTPTYEFPHPLARVPQSAGYWLSYIVVDLLIWWGIRGYINDFRKRNLKLAPIAYFSLYRGSVSHLPTAYMWSPHVMPKPSDWGPQVDVVGYCFLNLGSKYQPPEEFVQWIQKGPQPIYIGFGSMPLEDPKKTTDIILEALKNTGQRGIICRGWGDLGTLPEVSDSVFPLEDCPHDWLFPQCLAVVHHGGAGTTATGLRAGCPTTIVPFFGDQFFWGERIYEKGLGPAPIPIAQFNVESLSDAVQFMLQPEVKSRAMEIAKLIENEDGVAAAVDAFHRHLPSELPVAKEDDQPNPLQWFFTSNWEFMLSSLWFIGFFCSEHEYLSCSFSEGLGFSKMSLKMRPLFCAC
ncbi:hypothetical protein HYC85_020115 [Camellia sinensis]|uniref:Glycosyltransferase family 28 N-terminal domain-containing protein n=1 Tax=Camellia sinensis TaxID=4442 RepID=A0A7J7GNV4_CAMSI|nr:hypothetical protein HYC85_020115 [Camellia sinensis]